MGLYICNVIPNINLPVLSGNNENKGPIVSLFVVLVWIGNTLLSSYRTVQRSTFNQADLLFPLHNHCNPD